MWESSGYVRCRWFNFVESTIGNLPKVAKAKFLGSCELFCFTSICKFGSFKNPFTTIISLSKLYFMLRRFILLVQTKKWFLWSMTVVQAAENHEDELGLTLYLRWGIYTLIPTWSHSQNSLSAAGALSLEISSHETSLKWSRRPSQSGRG